MTKQKSDIIYTYDGSFDGLLCCIFEMYEKKENPFKIEKSGSVQTMLDCRIKDIETDLTKASRVHDGIFSKIGEEALTQVYYATLSAEEDAETAAKDFIRLGFKMGLQTINMLTDQRVWHMKKIAHKVSLERMRYIEFIRFREMEGHVLFSDFKPEPNILPLIMPHFSDRLNTLPFIIHDKGRKLAGVYDTKEWFIISSNEMTLPEISDDERDYQKLWKLFYDSVAIKERLSERRRMQHIPKKYWKYVTELSR